MFGFIEDVIDDAVDVLDNTLDIGARLVEGESPTVNDIRVLVEAGVSIAAISDLTGISIDAIVRIVDE